MLLLQVWFLCHQLDLTLFDWGSTYSYISCYYAPRLEFSYDLLSMSLRVSTLVGDSLVSSQIMCCEY